MRKVIAGLAGLVFVSAAAWACNPLPTQVRYDCEWYTQDTSATVASGDTVRDVIACDRTQ